MSAAGVEVVVAVRRSGWPLPALVMGHGPDQTAAARVLAQYLVECRSLVQVESGGRSERRHAADRAERFRPALQWDDAPEVSP